MTTPREATLHNLAVFIEEGLGRLADVLQKGHQGAGMAYGPETILKTITESVENMRRLIEEDTR